MARTTSATLTASDVPRLPLEDLRTPAPKDLPHTISFIESVGHESLTTTTKSKLRHAGRGKPSALTPPSPDAPPPLKSEDAASDLAPFATVEVMQALPPAEPLREGRLHMNTVQMQNEDARAAYPGSCVEWIREQSEVRSAAMQDGLAFAVEFQDTRPDCGGWIRLGYGADSQLRYSCNGELRDPFRQAILTVAHGEAYVSFPDIDRGVVFGYTRHAAEVLLPSMRCLFDEAAVVHNIPDDEELASHLALTPTLCPTLTPGSPGRGIVPRHPPLPEVGCNILHCRVDSNACCVM